jgi:hypothetical protein
VLQLMLQVSWVKQLAAAPAAAYLSELHCHHG